MTGLRLRDRVAVITGGTRGLGRRIAEAYEAEGATVVVAARGAGDGDEQVDVTDAESVRELFDRIERRYGRVDVAVANAGASRPGPVATLAPEAFAEVLATNLAGTFHTVQAAVPALERAGGGRILTVSSALATRVTPGAAAYSASKAAIEAFTRTAAVELAPRGIAVNCLAPGIIAEGMGEQLIGNAAVWARYGPRLASGRPGTGAEVAAVAVFLAGPDAGYVNGAVVEVHGGLDW
ncbi:SDR family NAD(P)-dependent oxidoreductase [Dactylosporangium sp. NPDC048998]|uniref:SDR family NAD(P)-dependent oxidoreductase n=1 Tax=Dactylosporangium sp. NPDC048998 TaxID=3363976 RepID=UPI0037238057